MAMAPRRPKKASKKSRPPTPKETIIALTELLAKSVTKAKKLGVRKQKRIISELGKILSQVDRTFAKVAMCDCYVGGNYVGYISEFNCINGLYGTCH